MITCPHCGFSKDVDQERVPANSKTISCPKCKQTFTLNRTEDTVTGQEVPAQPKPVNKGMGPVPAPKNVNNDENYTTDKFCSTCGEKIHKNTELCPHCGVRIAPSAKSISKMALLLITFFFGGMGGHKFYQKKYLLGVLYFLFFWTYIPSIAAFVEFIIYAFKSETDLQEKYPETCGSAILFVIAIPVLIAIVGILAAIAIPQFAAYREKAYNATAKNDIRVCEAQAEAYYIEHQTYPTEASQLDCQVSNNGALHYLSIEADEYQLISYNTDGRTAFLKSSYDPEIAENTRVKVEEQLLEKYGVTSLPNTFHFLK
jgi:predicted Zn finger-like uncharacterized protein